MFDTIRLDVTTKATIWSNVSYDEIAREMSYAKIWYWVSYDEPYTLLSPSAHTTGRWT